MYPIVCFSCGTPIGQLWAPYWRELAISLGDEHQRLDDDGTFQRDMSTGAIDYYSNARFLTLNKLGVRNECCRRMFCSQIKYTDMPIIHTVC